MGMTFNRAGTSIYKSKEWKALRHQAKRRDGFACVQCGKSGDLEVDHIKPIRSHPDLALTLANLQTLCVACHSRKTRVEVGLSEIPPDRQAWKSLLQHMQKLSSKQGKRTC